MTTESQRLEQGRLAFIESRDGKAAAIAFARQTLTIYRNALARNTSGRRHGYGLTYRRELLESCIIFRRYLRK